ncbi:PAS domain-containing protein [Alkaliphilus peptidifermentans]|uniref:PAS domain S-box-containing protein n=1 Tax=Alkaliphilus peptidifermentans DSM 18978 TaxID=1120976 RepID=A0A1G5EZR7_9FIRM|nr:PAS domain-containing protein [Alkaliphilus peptidifermentans]SCY32463.1 PAS domain S-box-containing protein [Alkaliphilus peptidifermentans DSM 18978]
MEDNIYNRLNFEELIDIFPLALYVVKDSKIIDCNKSAVNIFGYEDKKQVIGRIPYDLSPEKQPDGSYSAIKGEEIINRALMGEKDLEFTWTHRRKNGSDFLTNIKIKNKKGSLYVVINDINEIDKLKQQLIQKEQSYQLLFNNHKSVMLLINPANGNIIDANQTAINYYGYSKDKLLTMKIQDINILDEVEVLKEMSLAKTEKRNYFQFTHRLSNNQLRDVEVHSFPIDIEDEKLLFSIIHDVSEKIEQKLMFDTLFFDSPYAVAILDKDQKIRNVNRNFTNMFQYYLEEVQGQAINDFVSTEQVRSQVDTNIQSVYRGDIIKKEAVRRRKDGSLVDVEVLCYPIINHNIIIGAYIIYTDISRKKSSEKQLHLFRKILDKSSDGVVITDIKGNIKWINKAFMMKTGYTFVQVIEKKVNILRSGTHDKVFYEAMWNEIKNKGSWSGVIYNKNKRGDIFPQFLSINSIEDENNVINYYVGIYKSIEE